MSAPHACSAHWGQKRALDQWATGWVLGIEPLSLEEQPVPITAKPSLQPLKEFIFLKETRFSSSAVTTSSHKTEMLLLKRNRGFIGLLPTCLKLPVQGFEYWKCRLLLMWASLKWSVHYLVLNCTPNLAISYTFVVFHYQRRLFSDFLLSVLLKPNFVSDSTPYYKTNFYQVWPSFLGKIFDLETLSQPEISCQFPKPSWPYPFLLKILKCFCYPNTVQVPLWELKT